MASRKAARLTVRCVQRHDPAAALAEVGATPGFIARNAGETSADLLIDAINNFDHTWTSTGRSASRYSDGSYPVLYTATREAVALTERAHWAIELVFKKTSDVELKNFYFYKCSVDGTFKDYSRIWRRSSRMFVHPSDYDYCHTVAAGTRSENSYILVPSARRLKGYCAPVFNKDAAAVADAYGLFRLVWDADLEVAHAVSESGRKRVRIDPVYDLTP